MRPSFALLLSAAGALALFLPAAMAADPDPRPITPRDLWTVHRLGGLRLSPDGTRAVFTRQVWDIEKNEARTNLWLLEVATGALRQLTRAEAADGAPAWSPDGRSLAFVSKRAGDEAAALYVLPLDGGEPERLAAPPYGAQAPRWLPDGSGLVFATSVLPEFAGDWEKLAAEVKRLKDGKVQARVTDNRVWRFWDRFIPEERADRLFRYDFATRQLTDLTPQSNRFFSLSLGGVEFDLSPDGQHAVVVVNSTEPPYRGFLNNDLYLVPVRTPGPWRNLTAGNQWGDGNPAFSPDGRFLFYTCTTSDDPVGESAKLVRLEVASGALLELTAAVDLSVGEIAVDRDGGGVFFTAEDRGSVSLFAVPSNGGPVVEILRGGTHTSLAVGERVLLTLHDTLSRPAEILAYDRRTRTTRLVTNVQAEWSAGLQLGRVEERTFAGAGGQTVQMFVVYPPDYDDTRKYPLLHLLHGGPQTMVRDSFSFRWNPHVFAAPGYVVAAVNRHGSTGFGEAFARSITREWGVKPTEDILRATDELLAALPALDPARVGAAGGSYGGYLACWLAGHTDRFATLVNHAGLFNTESFFSTDIPQWFELSMGGAPWSDRAALARNNPATYLANWRTPMLVIHGEKDFRVPVGQGFEAYAALQGKGLPARMVYYPDENHWVLKPQNALHWYEQVHGWLARWLKP